MPPFAVILLALVCAVSAIITVLVLVTAYRKTWPNGGGRIVEEPVFRTTRNKIKYVDVPSIGCGSEVRQRVRASAKRCGAIRFLCVYRSGDDIIIWRFKRTAGLATS